MATCYECGKNSCYCLSPEVQVESLRTQLAEVQREHNALVLDVADFLTERDEARAEVEQLRREIAAYRDTEASLNATLERLDKALEEVKRERDEARAEAERLAEALNEALLRLKTYEKIHRAHRQQEGTDG